MIDKLLAQLRNRKAEFEAGVFDHPPKDWAEFQKRLGQHEELSKTLNDIMDLAKGKEDPDDI